MEAKGKGIVLLHDIQPVTVLALPKLLRELKVRGFRVVHVVSSTPDRPKTVTEPEQWTHGRARANKPWPRALRRAPRAGELPAPSPLSFGISEPFGPKAAVSLISSPRSWTVAAAGGPVPLPPLAPWPRIVGPMEIATEAELPAPAVDNFAFHRTTIPQTDFPDALRPSVDPMITGSARSRPRQRPKPASTAAASSPVRATFMEQPPRPPAALRARPRAPDARPVATSSLRPE